MSKKDVVWQKHDVAHKYLEGVRRAFPMAAEQIEIMLRVIKAAQPLTSHFLDLGCGDGVLGKALLGEFPDATGVLLDFSEPMIDAARAKLHDHAAQVTFLLEDYGDPSWLNIIRPHAPFDVIVSGFSIHHQPDARKKEVYQELYDLLKPGGVFLNLEHVLPASEWVENLFNELFIDALVGYSQSIGSNQTRKDIAQAFLNREDKSANILATTEAQCQWLSDIGFQHVDCYFKIYELALFGGLKPENA